MIINYSELDPITQLNISKVICERLEADFGRPVQTSVLTRALIMFDVSVEVRNADAFLLRHNNSLESAVRYLNARL